ncbi:hypothetical protein [Parasphingorhabdus sp.]|jgi:hypothetical protein|uniref:hypothetical protein n=1 Tax=Parasphingorhabdus sp. TaxID=2709688 RepID=UPI0030A07043
MWSIGLIFRIWLLFPTAKQGEFTNRQIAETGSSLRSFRHIAKAMPRRPKQVKQLLTGLVFEE